LSPVRSPRNAPVLISWRAIYGTTGDLYGETLSAL
jgi:hypothetical protein